MKKPFLESLRSAQKPYLFADACGKGMGMVNSEGWGVVVDDVVGVVVAGSSGASQPCDRSFAQPAQPLL